MAASLAGRLLVWEAPQLHGRGAARLRVQSLEVAWCLGCVHTNCSLGGRVWAEALVADKADASSDQQLCHHLRSAGLAVSHTMAGSITCKMAAELLAAVEPFFGSALLGANSQIHSQNHSEPGLQFDTCQLPLALSPPRAYVQSPIRLGSAVSRRLIEENVAAAATPKLMSGMERSATRSCA